MPILSMMAIWSFSNMYASGFSKLNWNIYSVAYIIGHIFRQSRMRLFGVLLCLLGISLYQRRFLMIAVALGMVAISSLVLQEVLEVDILGENVTMTVEDISKTKGTFRVRMLFIREALKEYLESPIVGTGGSAIRPFKGAYDDITRQQFQQFSILGKQTDIGILNWVKDFGLLGLAWIVTFFFTLSRLALHALKNPDEDRRLALFCAFFLFFVMATSLTLEHLITSETIPPVMFVSAILVRMRYGWREDTNRTGPPSQQGLDSLRAWSL